ncbi:MAG: hypothetical protein DWQ36_09970 [Acidobacteria bacterium]|nr:MAG: hypothetical protein DWQ36_09970 [Acidobacteriota bacterium]
MLIFVAVLLAVSSAAVVATVANTDTGAGPPQNGSMGITTGPDVTIYQLTDTENYGAVGGIRAYSVGTNSCNIGSEVVNWCDNSGGCGAGLTPAQHPVIAQNMYRLSEGRFEQLGLSWLKHGFLSTNTSNPGCVGNNGAGQPTTCQNPGNSSLLGVGCTDTYGAGLNGSWSWSGPRFEVDSTKGIFPFPASNGSTSSAIDQRIQVEQNDIDPVLNPDARFWVEGHYVVDNDALANNGLNNASYREVSVNASNFNLSFLGSTVRELSAIHAWQAADPSVEIVNVDFVSGAGAVVERFEAARSVTFDGGVYTTVIAIRNMNSDRAARRLLAQFGGSASISDGGFNDVDYHSGEPWAPTDWTISSDSDSIEWFTDTFGVDPNANALRWSTMYTFWFDSTADPTMATYSLDLFKPGSPSSVTIPFSGMSPVIFTDGFESGDLTSWSSSTP